MIRVGFKQLWIAMVITTVLVSSASAADLSDTKLRANLQRVAAMRIYFGHQSVGGNILDGVKQLSVRSGVPLRIVETKSAHDVNASTLGHTFVAENRNPFGKIKAFELAMGPTTSSLDVAMLKFCYLDFTADTDANALFARYRTMVDSLRARNPRTNLVHITTPLTIVQTGPKAFLKNLLGLAPYGARENLRREEYNALLRQEYDGREPFLDLARLESTTEDGKNVRVEWHGQSIPAMANAYSDDGGHLNAKGQLRIASEFLSVIAALPLK